ncbi:hypothetical protein AVEN_267169-1 [Araneus ventricosus]|uniref:Uncharacterized protein n=1 Tax=Araneus ventricosus TaxID=182803 RepID=A0A4Y2T800_ARAVE|nr:hypothetical protein AVEN_267169-1 [Araneus ventricosus]
MPASFLSAHPRKKKSRLSTIDKTCIYSCSFLVKLLNQAELWKKEACRNSLPVPLKGELAPGQKSIKTAFNLFIVIVTSSSSSNFVKEKPRITSEKGSNWITVAVLRVSV